ncbi:hypothetical protein J5N97_019157 [Dioscorea zingiberensis]|uniref:Uncharacterized protein n=1 Tax=Dioscorea zingiberensis TaxID=325984 RepID=A0A9D5CEE7_9LILI|nr:hypothetical protein J5N97_019157 [Dioscorea zingiberensis]
MGNKDMDTNLDGHLAEVAHGPASSLGLQLVQTTSTSTDHLPRGTLGTTSQVKPHEAKHTIGGTPSQLLVTNVNPNVLFQPPKTLVASNTIRAHDPSPNNVSPLLCNEIAGSADLLNYNSLHTTNTQLSIPIETLTPAIQVKKCGNIHTNVGSSSKLRDTHDDPIKQPQPPKNHITITTIPAHEPSPTSISPLLSNENAGPIHLVNHSNPHPHLTTPNKVITITNEANKTHLKFPTKEDTQTTKEPQVIQLGEGTTIDLTTMKPRNIGGSWILVPDEAWGMLEEMMNRPATQKETLKPRGRPRKKPLNEANTVQQTGTSTNGTTTRKKQKARPTSPGMNSSLITIPLTLTEWPSKEIIASAITVGGMDPEQPGDDMDTYVSHMRSLEVESVQRVINGQNKGHC